MHAFAIFGHPGHELIVLQWIADESAEVFCLTNGSGGAMQDRTEYSRATVGKVGGKAGTVFGPWSDRDLYTDLLNGDVDRILVMTRDIVDRARAVRPPILLTDALEYFNPIHDLANTITDIAVRALVDIGEHPRKLVYPNEYPARLRGIEPASERALAEPEQRQKLDAIMAYTPLVPEFDRMRRRGTVDLLVEERIYPDAVRLNAIPPAEATAYNKVFYEEYGARMVAEGRYNHLITLDGHVRPMAARLVEAFGFLNG